MKFLTIWLTFVPLSFISACMGESGEGGSAGAKVFLALGICLAAVFLIFYIVVKGRERE